MKTSLEKLGSLKRELTVDLSIDIFKQKTDKILRSMASKVTVDGFRKGRVPLSIMRKQFGERAHSDVVNEIVNDTLVEALVDVKVTPASQPMITKIDAENKDIFSYTVTFEIFPEIKVADFSKLKVEQAEVEITEADEEKTLEGLIEQATEYKPVKRKSKEGDQVTIDFKGTLEGEVFEGGVASDFKMVLGKGSMIVGFEDGLLGVCAGESVTLNLTFPKEYHSPQLAAKDVVFEVDMKEVAIPKSLKLDDEFAKRFGEKNIGSLKKSMKIQMQVELDNRLTNQNKDDLFGALLEANNFEVPKESISNEAQSLKQEMEQRLQQQGTPFKGNMPASTFNPEAERRVKLGLLVNQISSDNKFNASKEQIDAKLNKMAATYGDEAQKMLDYYDADPSRLATIELMVVEQMVQDLILESAKVTIKKKTFKEVTQH